MTRAIIAVVKFRRNHLQN